MLPTRHQQQQQQERWWRRRRRRREHQQERSRMCLESATPHPVSLSASVMISVTRRILAVCVSLGTSPSQPPSSRRRPSRPVSLSLLPPSLSRVCACVSVAIFDGVSASAAAAVCATHACHISLHQQTHKHALATRGSRDQPQQQPQEEEGRRWKRGNDAGNKRTRVVKCVQKRRRRDER